MAPESDQSEEDAPPDKKNLRKSITLAQKLDILRRYDRGESTDDIRSVFHLAESTLRTIRKNRERILAAVDIEAGRNIQVSI